MDNMATNRAVWQALRFGKPVSMDYLLEITGEAARPIIGYLNKLMAHGFVCIANIRRAGSGEAVFDFRLARNSGPKAPYVDKFGVFVDPNDISKMAYADRAQKLKAPNISAVVWVKAQSLGEFTVSDVVDALNKPYTEKRIWTAINNLFLAGYVTRVRRGVYKAAPLPDGREGAEVQAGRIPDGHSESRKLSHLGREKPLERTAMRLQDRRAKSPQNYI